MSNTESRDYFVRRHGMFFREGATGYVNGIGNAGRFTKADAGAFLDVEGVSVHRVSGYSERCRSEEHTSELQSLMRISYAVFCLKKKKRHNTYAIIRLH